MIRFAVVFHVFLSAIGQSNAQNLLKNPSFEKGGMSKNHFPLSRVRNWRNPTIATPDFLSNREIHLDYKTPFGEKFIGLVYVDFLDRYHAEYAESAKFKEQLEPGKAYCLRFHTYLDEKMIWSTKEIHVAFTRHATINRFKWRMLKKPNYVKFNDSSKLKVAGEWVHWAAVYNAKGKEGHLILGFFEDTIPLTRIRPEFTRYVPTSYYAFDNLELFEVEDTSECTCERPKQYYEADAIEFENEFIVENRWINSIQFDLNSSKLTESSKLELKKFSQYLQQMYKVSIKVVGHTDTTGTDSANQLLSLSRARSVKRFLVRNGIDKERISVKGYGSSHPVSSDPKENRRVEILLSRP